MFKRFIIAILGAILLSVVFSASVQAASFTMNGNDGYIECAAPCHVEFQDLDPGSYEWDFDYNSPGFDAMASGNPVNYTYTQLGMYQVVQQVNGQLEDSGTVNVLAPEDTVPEDIELVSPASGTLPMALRFQTTRRNLEAYCSGGCDGDYLGRTGPDGEGRYVHTFVLSKAPGNLEVTVQAWNSDVSAQVQDRFAITVTGKSNPFGQARWKVRSRGGKCQVKYRRPVTLDVPHTSVLKLKGAAGGQKVKKTFRIAERSGGSMVKGKLVLPPDLVSKLPGKATAKLKVRVGDITYPAKDVRKLRACA